MSKPGCTLTVLLLSALWCQGALATDVYKWTDADGGVHYGQQPPAGAPAQTVTLHHDDQTAADAKAELADLVDKAGLDPATLAAAQAVQTEARATQASVEEERRVGCARAARAEAKLGNWAKHLLATDGSGTVTTVGSQQREAAIERIREWRAANDCP